MNDQIILLILGFAATLIGVMTPIIKLNTSITKLNTTLDAFQKQTASDYQSLNKRVTEHGKDLDELKTTVAEINVKLGYIGKE